MKHRPFRMILGVAAGLILLASAGVWLATGAHRGWSQTRITEMHHDEITGIDYPVTRDGFVAGLDLLAAGSGLAALLGGVALVAGRRRAQAAV